MYLNWGWAFSPLPRDVLSIKDLRMVFWMCLLALSDNLVCQYTKQGRKEYAPSGQAGRVRCVVAIRGALR